MKIVVISGSTRADSQSLKVAEYLMHRLQEFGAETALIDLNKQRLPLYDDDNEGSWQTVWQPMEQQMDQADGFVMISPEWDGMFSAGLHNLFNFVASASTLHVMAHKPVTLVGVSDGMGGVYPLAQMRMTGHKNTHFVATPESLRFVKVKEALVDGVITIDGLRDRADYSLKILLEYARALGLVRASGTLDYKNFKNGI